MTVAVSVASGVAAIVAAFPVWPSGAHADRNRVLLCIGLIILVALANLRGVRESGRIFAIPTYLFVAVVRRFGDRGLGALGHGRPASRSRLRSAQTSVQGLALAWIVLRAFSGGCSAMTGTEAISNAVPAFKAPESKNASITLGVMAAILGFLLLGVTALGQVLHVVPQRGRHRARADRPRRVRRRLLLLRPADSHHVHPGAGGQHQLHRLPPPGLGAWPKTG